MCAQTTVEEKSRSHLNTLQTSEVSQLLTDDSHLTFRKKQLSNVELLYPDMLERGSVRCQPVSCMS